MQVTEVLHKKILLLSANPISTTRLRTDEEMREIEESLKRATKRELFSIQTSTAVTYRDIRRAILDYQPNIVQFSGHGEGKEGLIFEDNTGESKLVSDKALAGLFELFVDQVECVFLNACYSQIQAESIVKHIPYVIGMSQEISDEAAIEFATGFYDALGAGETFDFAFKFGCNGILLADISEELTPQLLKKSNYDNCELNGKQIITSEEVQEENPKKRVCNLLFEYEEDNFSKIQVIQSMLREIVGDDSITIIDIEKGSIKLILQGSQAGLERLEELFKSGELKELLDIPIEDVSFLDKQVLDEDNQITECKKLAFTIAADVSQEEILNLKDKLVKASKDYFGEEKLNLKDKLVKACKYPCELQNKGKFNTRSQHLLSPMQIAANSQSRHLNGFLLQGVLDGFIDGILIITAQGELIHSNQRSQKICQQLSKEDSQTKFTPQVIWQVCQALLDIDKIDGEQKVIVETEIKLEDSDADSTLRVRARWLELEDFKPCILVTIEDQTQSLQNMLFTEVAQHSLTPREQDAWLLRQAGYTYKDLANELSISLNNVKKHLKNIRLQLMSCEEFKTYRIKIGNKS